MAKIIFLGTAGDSAVMNKQIRSSGGIILQIDDLQLHLDPGPGALNKAKEYGVNVHHTTVILVSHNHLNHCNDLNVVIDAMTHGGMEHRGLVMGSKSVLLTTEDNQSFLTSYHQSLPEKIIVMDPGHKVGLDSLEITALATDHTDPSALGFKFACPKFTLGYSGDTALSPELIDQLQGCDVLILNVPYLENKSGSKNLDMGNAIYLITQVKPKLVILNHFGLELLKANPLFNIVRDIQQATNIPIIAAQEGMSISPDGYRSGYNPVKGYS